MPVIENNQLIHVNNDDVVNGEFIIPNEVVSIHIRAFQACTSLTKVILNNQLDETIIKDLLFNKIAIVQVISSPENAARVLRFNMPEFAYNNLIPDQYLPIDEATLITIQLNEDTIYIEPTPEGTEKLESLAQAVEINHIQRNISQIIVEFYDYIVRLPNQFTGILTFLKTLSNHIKEKDPYFHLTQMLINHSDNTITSIQALEAYYKIKPSSIQTLAPGIGTYNRHFEDLLKLLHQQTFLLIHQFCCLMAASDPDISDFVKYLFSNDHLRPIYQALITDKNINLQEASVVTARITMLIKDLTTYLTKLTQHHSTEFSTHEQLASLDHVIKYLETRTSHANNSMFFPVKRGLGGSSRNIRKARHKQRERIRSLSQFPPNQPIEDIIIERTVDPRHKVIKIQKNKPWKPWVIPTLTLLGLSGLATLAWELLYFCASGLIIGTYKGQQVNYTYDGRYSDNFNLDALSSYRIIPNQFSNAIIAGCVLNDTTANASYYCEAPTDQHPFCFDSFLTKQCLWGYHEPEIQGYASWYHNHWGYCAPIATNQSVFEMTADTHSTITFSAFELGVSNSTGENGTYIQQSLIDQPVVIQVPAGYVGLAYSKGTNFIITPTIPETTAMPDIFKDCEITVKGRFGSKTLKPNTILTLSEDDVQDGDYSLASNGACPTGGYCWSSDTSMRDGEYNKARLFGCQSTTGVYKYSGQSVQCYMNANVTFNVPQF